MTKQHITNTTPTSWEEQYGYSRAVRVGPYIHIAGTTATNAHGEVVGQTVYDQTTYIFQIIEDALKQLGATLDDVVRTRAYITDISQHNGFGMAHKKAVGSARPAATLVEVQKLILPQHLIEIEVDAYAPKH